MECEEDDWFIVCIPEEDMVRDFWSHLATDISFEEFQDQLLIARELKQQKRWSLKNIFIFLWNASGWFSTAWSVINMRASMILFIQWYFR